MKIQILSSVDLLQSLTETVDADPDASVAGPVERKTEGPMEMGLHDLGEVVLVIKTLAPLAPLLIQAAQALWKKHKARSGADAPSDAVKVQVKTQLGTTSILITSASTEADVEAQLVALKPST